MKQYNFVKIICIRLEDLISYLPCWWDMKYAVSPAESVRHPPKKWCLRYDTKLQLMVRLPTNLTGYILYQHRAAAGSSKCRVPL